MERKPTGTQLEILEAVWNKGRTGATIAEIRDELGEQRAVARTTVLTLVQRLEKQGWLVVDTTEKAHRYRAARPKETTQRRLVRDLVDRLFGGSASALVASLLGSHRIDRAEIARLRALLDARAKEEA